MTGFTLPAGAKVDEENGDFVVKDSNGTIVFRRNESANEWQFESTDLTGINQLNAAGPLTIDGQQSDYHWELLDSHVDEDRDSPLDVSFTGIGDYRFLMIEGTWLTREVPVLRVNELDNANDSADYRYFKTNGNRSSDNGSFFIAGGNNRTAHGQIVVLQSKPAWSGNRVTVAATIGSERPSLTSGILYNISPSSVDRLDMFAQDDGNGNQRGGFVGELYGRNGTIQ